MKCNKKDLLLYAVTDRSWLKNRTLAEQVEEALKGGATIIQLREKDLDDNAFLEEAKQIQKICKRYQAKLIINDNVSVAMKMNADGIHIGQKDMSMQDAKAMIGEDKILGVSVQTVEQAMFAEQMGADYLGVGAVFPTTSKSDADAVSYEMLQSICHAVNIPVVAIGGIGEHNILTLADSGIAGVAVISAIFAAPDIRQATAELKKLTEQVTDYGD